jgi:hypothetical protein
MDHHPAQFVFKRDLVDAGVVGYAFTADEYVAVNFRQGVRECYDVCIVIVFQVFDVYLPEVLIGAEDIIDFQECFSFFPGNSKQPLRYKCFVGKVKGYVLKMKGISSRGMAGNCMQDDGSYNLNRISTVLPPRLKLHSSLRCRIKKRPRPPHFSRNSGLVGSGT